MEEKRTRRRAMNLGPINGIHTDVWNRRYKDEYVVACIAVNEKQSWTMD